MDVSKKKRGDKDRTVMTDYNPEQLLEEFLRKDVSGFLEYLQKSDSMNTDDYSYQEYDKNT